MVHFTYEEFKALEPKLIQFLRERPVDIPLTVEGELVLRFLSLFEISKYDRVNYAFGNGNAPVSAVAELSLEYRMKGREEDESVAVYGGLYLEADFSFTVHSWYTDAGPLYPYLRKAFEEFVAGLGARSS